MDAHPTKRGLVALPFGGATVPFVEYCSADRLSSEPLVSVIMLAYRHERYIEQAISGILAQRRNFSVELLIGEDCSGDDTAVIALAYQRQYPSVVRIITAERNVGARKNAYRLEMLARGRYIAYCEADDYWHDPHKLARQIGVFAAEPQTGLVFTNADSFDVTTVVRRPFAIPVHPSFSDHEDPYRAQLLGRLHLWPLTVCLRTRLLREVLQDCPEPTDTTYAMGDTPRFLELARRTRFAYLPLSTATRNLLPESATRSRDISRRARFVASSERLTLHYLNKYPLDPDSDGTVRHWVARRTLYYAFLTADRLKADEARDALRAAGLPLGWKTILYFLGTRHDGAHMLVSALLALIHRDLEWWRNRATRTTAAVARGT